jgi:hypothetical protein
MMMSSCDLFLRFLSIIVRITTRRSEFCASRLGLFNVALLDYRIE